MTHPSGVNRNLPKWMQEVKKAEGGSVADDDMTSAKARLGEALKDREADIYNPEHSIMDRDRREATRDASASGDYDASGTYKPWNPKRGPR